MFASVIAALLQGTGVERASVLTFDDNGVMRFRAAHGLSDAYKTAVDGHSPWSVDTVNPPPLLVSDVATDPAADGLREVFAAEGIAALAFLPLSGDGHLLGKFMLYSAQPTTWADVDLEFAGAVADLLTSFIMREQAQDRLLHARKMESLGLLAGGIAHDFNNMLTSMMGYVDLARVETMRGTPAREYIDELRTTVEQAADLTRQLLGFARPLTLSSELLDIRRLLDDARPSLQNLCGPLHPLRIDVEGAPVPVRAGRTQLQQVLTNLVANARDAMPAGGTIAIRARAGRAGMVDVMVSDTGVGMDSTTRRRIFEPLFTTKRLGRGTGLGLATCYAIVTSLGGDITVRSTPGKGSDFIVSLPAGALAAANEPAASRVVVEHGAAVLLVDDESSVLRPLVRALEMSGYVVHTASNGREALDWLDAHEVDIVVSDVIMPVMDGLTLVGETRRRWPEVPVMLITGYVDGARELPSDVPVLLKPFKPRELCGHIDRLLDGRPGRSDGHVSPTH